ncbi:hypothetical protein B0H16DRAFT_1474191 [Mycena metata]|uniref:Uncharacterized protein n=1 Tax=Mycena metata TaxID=1033252 RepID=A0AAD7MJW5_9AGAR|nr:hypothetical protein B0H16DRAFT_1474191 [Mycena metata]
MQPLKSQKRQDAKQAQKWAKSSKFQMFQSGEGEVRVNKAGRKGQYPKALADFNGLDDEHCQFGPRQHVEENVLVDFDCYPVQEQGCAKSSGPIHHMTRKDGHKPGGRRKSAEEGERSINSIEIVHARKELEMLSAGPVHYDQLQVQSFETGTL